MDDTNPPLQVSTDGCTEICANCKHYDWKTSGSGEGPQNERGRCLRSEFHEGTKIYGKSNVIAELTARLSFEEAEEIVDMLELRVVGDFGCRHFERSPYRGPHTTLDVVDVV